MNNKSDTEKKSELLMDAMSGIGVKAGDVRLPEIKKDRTKSRPTPKQDKWKDPFFRNAISSRIGRHRMVTMLRKVKLARRG